MIETLISLVKKRPGLLYPERLFLWLQVFIRYLTLPHCNSSDPSQHEIFRQEIAPVPIDDPHLGFLGRVDVKLVEDHHLLVL